MFDHRRRATRGRSVKQSVERAESRLSALYKACEEAGSPGLSSLTSMMGELSLLLTVGIVAIVDSSTSRAPLVSVPQFPAASFQVVFQLKFKLAGCTSG
mgnify:CR=1 FL=1